MSRVGHDVHAAVEEAGEWCDVNLLGVHENDLIAPSQLHHAESTSVAHTHRKLRVEGDILTAVTFQSSDEVVGVVNPEEGDVGHDGAQLPSCHVVRCAGV